MTCRLCKKERELKNSHIIPEFLYSSLYDEKHRFHKISTDRDKRNTLVQKGIREYLLCGDCEQKLSKFETYSRKVLIGGTEITVRNEGGLIHLEGIDYKKFKLFALSILWRSSVSSLEVFENIKLGVHEEIIGNMILNGDAGSASEYPFIMSPMTHEGKLQKDLIVQPTKTKLDGHQAYRFTFGGVFWLFIVSKHKVPEIVVSSSINEEGKLTMLPREISDMKFISRTAIELVRQGKV